jgi:hypothetical protein
MTESKSKFQVTCMACGETHDASTPEAAAKFAEKHGADTGHSTITENVIGDGDGAVRTHATQAAQAFKDAQKAPVVTSAQIDAQEAKLHEVSAAAPAKALPDDPAVPGVEAPAPKPAAKKATPAKKTAAKTPAKKVTKGNVNA